MDRKFFLTKHRAAIIKLWEELFQRKISDAEADAITGNVFDQTDRVLAGRKDMSGAERTRYLAGPHMVGFSPRAALDEVFKTISAAQDDEYETSNKYKMTREMQVACLMALALKKHDGDEWVIKVQDAPDIILVRESDERELGKKPFAGAKMEIMQIPEIAKSKWQGDFYGEMARFIEAKKFMNRYGDGTSLAVYINFTQLGFVPKKIFDSLKNLKGNPFHSIYLIAWVKPDQSRYRVWQIHPSYSEIEFDFPTDAKFIY